MLVWSEWYLRNLTERSFQRSSCDIGAATLAAATAVHSTAAAATAYSPNLAIRTVAPVAPPDVITPPRPPRARSRPAGNLLARLEGQHSGRTCRQGREARRRGIPRTDDAQRALGSGASAPATLAPHAPHLPGPLESSSAHGHVERRRHPRPEKISL